MKPLAARFSWQVVVAFAGAWLGASAALASDSLDGLAAIAPSQLNLIRTDVSNRATITNTTINATNGGQVVNGAIQNNSVTNNHGVTSVLQNTGNNVNFNSALIVNVFTK
jgi:uncharacterized protein YPO0396